MSTATEYSVELDGVIKYFGRRLIFGGISFSFAPGVGYGISGPNGSGKSTLVKIIAGLIAPTRGKVIHTRGGKTVKPEEYHNHIGFVSPYLYLYDEFTALENLSHFQAIRGLPADKERTGMLLSRLDLYERKDDLVRGYSSGMKQRLRLIFALIHNPDLLILDEPVSNLDNSGKEKLYSLVREEAAGRVLIVASNEEADLELCGEMLYLENFKGGRV